MDIDFDNLTPEEIERFSDRQNFDANPPELDPDFVWVMAEDRQRRYLEMFGDSQETREMFLDAFGYEMTV